MTPHDHRTYVDGCYRCELGRDEVRDAASSPVAATRSATCSNPYPTRPWRIEHRISDSYGNVSEWRRILGSYSTPENAQKAIDRDLVVSSAYPRETRIVEVPPAPRGDAE